MILRGMFGTRGDPDRVIRNAFASGEDGIWVAPRLGGMYQDAALSTPWTADGQAVGGYVDRSPNGHVGTQSTSTARPAGHSDRLVGDGVDDFLTFGDILDIRTGSYFIVAVASFATTAASQCIASKANASTDGRYSLNRGGSGQLQSFIETSGNYFAGVADTSTARRVISAIVDRATGVEKLRINGAEAASASWTPESVDYNTPMSYTLMAFDSGASQRLNGDINELVQVMRVPSSGEIEAIEARLAAVHGI